jgi:Baseplate J-like protein
MTSSLRPPAPHSRRRSEVLEQTGFGNGIDHLEVDPLDHTKLTVGLINPMPATGPWGLDTNPSLAQVTGGEKIRGIRVTSVDRADATTLAVIVDKPGDFSPYTLDLGVTDLDPVLRRTVFSFMAACRSDLDCVEPGDKTIVDEDGPPLDMLSKDYASFRRMLLDLVALRHPSQTEQHAADLGITLLELLAAHGDELSYQQDAAFAEAYLDTAHRRISVRRHARLVDYVLAEGRNATVALHLQVTKAITVAATTRVFTRLPAALPGTSAPPGPAFDAALLTEPAFALEPLAGATVFETVHAMDAAPRNNLLHVHHWGEDEFGIPVGGTSAWLWAQNAADTRAVRPPLVAGDYVVLEQVRAPRTGRAADRDPAQRWVLQLTEVLNGSDPAYQDTYTRDTSGQVVLAPRSDPAGNALPLLGVRWDAGQAPASAVCVRTLAADGDRIEDAAVGRGNIVLADHGRTLTEDLPGPAASDAGSPGTVQLVPPLRLRLVHVPLTQRSDGPALALTVLQQTGPPEAYLPVADLFESGPDDAHVVVEVDDDGRGLLRFGDGVLGRRPLDAARFVATYRIGNGTAGNVGAEALAHVALPAAGVSAISAVRNPLPAGGGGEPETLEHARRLAPDAFRAWQERAVIADDVVAWALRVPGVRAAVAALRWTGSWYTWIVAVLPGDPADLVDIAGTRQELSGEFRAAVVAGLDHVRLAGFDVDVRAPEFVAVDLRLHVCARPGHTRSDVAHAVRETLLASALPSGQPGLLAGVTLTFGRPLLLGDVYARAAALPAVDTVKATWLSRYGEPPGGELENGRLDVAPWQLLRLDDDRSLPGRGVLGLDVDGGMP